jgi:hypothetical protein
MKNYPSRLSIVLGIMVCGLVYVSSCTHDNSDLEEFVPGVPVSETELVAIKALTAPTIDGTIDDGWEKAQRLVTRTVVPDPGDNLYAGYVGNAYNVSMRAMYDDANIYMLMEWDDPTGNFNRQPFFFDPTTKRWRQEAGEHTVNANGQITRPAFGEDKFGVLWNINNSIADWGSKTCWASCHTGLGAANGYARHYTNSATERIDMWHWKSVRDNPGNMDDQYQDNTQPNGRKSDPSVSGTGALDNRQDLTITGTTTVVRVPKYVIPGRDNYFWISKAEIDNGTAKLITAVNADGILTYNGGVIDPNGNPEFQRDGAAVGKKGIPSVSTSLLQGSRGDIEAKAVHTLGRGWVLEIKRKLKTEDAVNDVDFSSLADQAFGIGVFDNTGHSHATKAGLMLKFKK